MVPINMPALRCGGATLTVRISTAPVKPAGTARRDSRCDNNSRRQSVRALVNRSRALPESGRTVSKKIERRPSESPSI